MHFLSGPISVWAARVQWSYSHSPRFSNVFSPAQTLSLPKRKRKCPLGAWQLFVVLLIFLAAQTTAQAETISQVYPNGSPRWNYELRDGVQHGTSELFYEDGSPMVSGVFDRGLKHGLFLYYRPDGSLREKVLYVRGLRKWRSSTAAPGETPPLALLTTTKHGAPNPTKVTLKTWSLPWLPFSSLDRITRRFGLSLGTSGENGEQNGRRTEAFFHLIFKKKYGLFVSGSQTWISGVSQGGGSKQKRERIFNEEQSTFHLAANYSPIQSIAGNLLLRVGYLRSFDTAPSDNTPVRSFNGPQRASDFAATFVNAETIRASGTVSTSRGYFSFQADLGADYVQYSVDNDTTESTALLRFNAGAAVGKIKWQLAAETANTLNLSGRSLFTAGGTATYITDSLFWFSLNSMVDQHTEVSAVLSAGSWLW